jgi:hypothetical protein
MGVFLYLNLGVLIERKAEGGETFCQNVSRIYQEIE